MVLTHISTFLSVSYSSSVSGFTVLNFVCTGSTERSIIDASEVAIHVFWNVLLDIKSPEGWPANRQYASSSRKTVTAVFVTYQSKQAPLPDLGIPGDTWLTKSQVYVKETTGKWTNWHQPIIHCPYDSVRVFGWSRSVQFKYLIEDSLKTERRRWDNKDRGNTIILLYSERM